MYNVVDYEKVSIGEYVENGYRKFDSVSIYVRDEAMLDEWNGVADHDAHVSVVLLIHLWLLPASEVQFLRLHVFMPFGTLVEFLRQTISFS
jgi:hypothetical protein